MFTIPHPHSHGICCASVVKEASERELRKECVIGMFSIRFKSISVDVIKLVVGTTVEAIRIPVNGSVRVEDVKVGSICWAVNLGNERRNLFSNSRNWIEIDVSEETVRFYFVGISHFAESCLRVAK